MNGSGVDQMVEAKKINIDKLTQISDKSTNKSYRLVFL